MPRAITFETRQALAARVVRPAWLIEIEWPEPAQTINLWTGVGSLAWDGKTWIGFGLVGGLTGIGKTDVETQIQQVTFTLSGVNPADLGTIENVSIKGSEATVWMALLTPDRRVIPNPLQMAIIDLDTLTDRIQQDGTATIVLTGQTGFWTLRQPLAKYWTTEEQQATYPDDTGFDLIPGLVNKQIAWTRT